MSNLSDFVGGTVKWYDEKYANKVEITTSTVWTVPAGVTKLAVALCGGGGAGDDFVDVGGGGSGMIYRELTVTPGENIAITIGAGGLYPSGNGGSTSFGAYVTANGALGAEETVKYGDGANGGSNGSAFTALGAIGSAEHTVTRYIDGKLAIKVIKPILSRYAAGVGGCGGGYDYPGVGGSYNTAPTGYGAGGASKRISPFGDGTAGICVIYY